MKKIKNRIISFNLAKHSLGLMVISAIAISIIGVNSALAIAPYFTPSVSGGDGGGGSAYSDDLVAKCSKLGKDHAGADIKNVDDQDLLQKCVSNGLCEEGVRKESGGAAGTVTGYVSFEIKDCNEADKLLKPSKTQKDYAAKMSIECAKYHDKPYDPKTMAQCVGPNGVCHQENNVMKCDDARKTNVDNGYNPDGSGGPGGEGTKNPDRADEPLSGDGIGSEATGDFLGFPSWNRDVYFKHGKQIGPQIMKIVLNITEILLRLAGISAVIVIIYAGAMFIIGSYSASPDGIAKAKTILINGVIGLIIAIAATAIITFIVGSLKGK